MAFFLFLLVNANLFVRPAEIVPSLLGLELYFYFILACLALSITDILRHLTEKPLNQQPITLLIFGMMILIPLSGLVTGNLAETWRASLIFAKIMVYYLLFVSLVTTPVRLHLLLLCILLCCGTMTSVAVLRYHDIIQLDTIKPVNEGVEGIYGETSIIQRLQGTGLLHDPNEFCVLLSTMIPLCLYFLMTDRRLLVRGLCVCMLPLFCYAIYLTHSRGGFLAFVGGLGALFWTRYGWMKTALIGLVGLPLLLFVFGGRQTEISTNTGTARSRIELWQDWLQTFRENPFLGRSMSMGAEVETVKQWTDEPQAHHAHNSYLQGFADLGFVGGCFFLGAFITAWWSVYRFHASECLQLNLSMKRLQPFVLASITAYCIGMLSLTICFVVPTYLILALSVSYTQIAQRTCLVRPPVIRFNGRLMGFYSAAGICFLFCMYMFVRLLA